MTTLLEGPRAASRHRDYYLLSLCYYLALRGGEVAAMRPEYIDVDSGEAYVPSEKRKAKRGQPVCEYTKRPLLKIPILFGDEVLRAAVRWSQGHGSAWMFPSRFNREKPISTRQVRLTWRLWARAAGLDARVSAHSLRHSSGTHVNEVAAARIQKAGGDPLVLVRDFMRHADIRTTSIYLHSTPSMVKAARDAMRGR